MHGSRAEDDPAADAAKRDVLEALLASVLNNHQQRCYTKQALEENGRLLEINPDLYTAWNYRKLALKHLLETEPDERARMSLVKEELKVNENALKSRLGWHHRKWLVGLGLLSLDHELEFLEPLFKVDEHNSHAWDYRRFIVGLKGFSDQRELDYSMVRIHKVWNNHSAWHNRSVLLLKLLKEKNEKEKQALLSREFDHVKQVLFMDPMDKTFWFYYIWLLGHSSDAERLVLEINMCRDVISDFDNDAYEDWGNAYEDQSKIFRLALARLLTRSNEAAHREEILSLHYQLIKMDPDREQYYKAMRDKNRSLVSGVYLDLNMYLPKF